MTRASKPWLRGTVTLAVIGALAGTMIASPVGAAFTPTKQNIKKIATKAATKVFNSKIGSASVANAANLGGNPASSYYTKTESDERYPLAYAHVQADGTLDPALSRNVSAVSNPSAGQYCFDLSVAPTNAVASVDPIANSAGDAQALVAAQATLSVCVPSGNTDAAVFTWVGSTNANRAFYVLFN